jgi:hypothetical protein
MQTTMSAFSKKLLAWASACLALAFIIDFYLEAGYETTAHPPSSDFYKFYLSGERLSQDKSIYWIIPPRIKPGDPCNPDRLREKGQPVAGTEAELSLGGTIPCLAPNLNPPIFMALIAPVSRLPYTQAWWAWAALSSACALVSLWLMAGTLTQQRAKQALLALWGSVLFFAYYPSYINFTLGQVGTLLLLPLTLAWLAMRRGHDARAGAWLGLATALKPFLGLLLLALLFTRRWRASMSFLMVLLTCSLIGVLWLGWRTYEHYMLVASHITWTTSNWNGSLVGFMDRAFSGIDPADWPEVRWVAKALSITASLASLGAVAMVLQRTRHADSTRAADMLFLVAIPATVLISPLGWLYYLPWLFIGAAITWQMSAGQASGRAFRLAFLAPLLATMGPIAMKAVPTPRNPTIWYGIDALYAYSLLGVFAVTVAMALWRLKLATSPANHQ